MLKKITILLLVGVSSIYPKNSLINGLTDIVDQAEEKETEDKKFLNYVFKQRMRTQWLARDALLLSMDINISFYQKEILQDAKDFNENFNQLMNNEKDIKKIGKTDPKFIQKIKDINSTWRIFYDKVKKISKNPKDKEALNFIIDNNIKLVKDINYIFTSFSKSYQSTDKLKSNMAHKKSVLYTLIGKPRMYIDKLVKERLLIKQNFNKEENQKNLKQSIKDMDRLLKALKDGDKGLELDGTEDRKIIDKLSISQKIWEDVKTLVQKKKLTKKELETLIKKNEDFIKAHTEVVKLTRNLNED